MKRSFALLLTCSALLLAQSAETIPYRVILSAANETPPIDIAASGTATVWLHLVRDASGKVVSASTDMNATFTLPADQGTITGMHIHRGNAGEAGPVLINTGVNTAAGIAAPAGRSTLFRQAQTAPTDTNGLDAVNGILANPAGYYLNIHTTTYPNGVIRGQLQRAQMVVLMGMMNANNEVPPTGVNATALTTITALRTPDGAGQVVFDNSYNGFADGTVITGYHIHAGPAGVNAPVTVNTGLNGTNTAATNTAGGTMHFEVDVPATGAASDTLAGLFTNPSNYYVNMHTAALPNGIIRGQLRNTDRLVYPVSMSPANEVPAVAVDASGIGTVTAYTLRDASGKVQAGTVIYDVNPRFPAGTTITGLHIHDGAASANGPVTIDSGIRTGSTVTLDSGAANIYRMVLITGGNAMSSLSSMTSTPENQYFNMHTTVNPGGAIRAQLSGSNKNAPTTTAAISAVSSASVTAGAPLGLMTVFGSNFFKVPGDLGGPTDGYAMTSYNGTSVTVGGKTAPMVVSGDGYMVIQVPADVPAGSAPLVVTNPNGSATALSVTIASTAPGLYYDSEAAIALKNSDYSLIRNDNPARAGDILLLYGTGFGQTTPPLATGAATPVTGGLANIAAPVTVTIGGRDARVYYAIASPGFIGLYQIAVQVPTGVPAGRADVVVKAGSASSNTAAIPVR